jgi:hypothetical protein
VVVIHNGRFTGELAGSELNDLETKFMEMTSGSPAAVGR